VKAHNGRAPDTVELLEDVDEKSAGASRALLSYPFSKKLQNTCPIDSTLELYFRLFCELNESQRSDLLEAFQCLAPPGSESDGLELAPITQMFQHFSRRFDLCMNTTLKDKTASTKRTKELKNGQKSLQDAATITWELWSPKSPGHMTQLSSKILAIIQNITQQVRYNNMAGKPLGMLQHPGPASKITTILEDTAMTVDEHGYVRILPNPKVCSFFTHGSILVVPPY
jgi:hypothetical protein